MPIENRHETIQRRAREIRAASAGNISEEDAKNLATAEADAGEGQGLLQQPVVKPPVVEEPVVEPPVVDDLSESVIAEQMRQYPQEPVVEDPNSNIEENAAIIAAEPEYDDGYVEPIESTSDVEPRFSEVGDASYAQVELETERGKDKSKEDDPFSAASIEKFSKELAARGPDYSPPVSPAHIQHLKNMKGVSDPYGDLMGDNYREPDWSTLTESQRANRIAFMETSDGNMSPETARYNADLDDPTSKLAIGYAKTAQQQLDMDTEEAELAERARLLRVEPWANVEQAHAGKELLEHKVDRLGRLRGGESIAEQKAADSPILRKYRAEQAAKKAKVQADKDSGSIRYISDDASETDTRVSGQLSAEDRAREAAGIPVKRKIYPPKAASDGRMLPMITHDPSLTTVIEVFDPPGSDNLVNRIVEDIPGARKELAQRKGAEGKVRMRQAEGGYARAADDEPYSRGDIYMSDSQAGRATSTAENRIREKARRKGLLARNRKLAKGWRDPKSPFAYGEDAAAVRIAQITADAEKAKAEAEARIKADDTLNAHQKELALIKAQAEIDAKAAAEQRAFDAEQNQEDRDVTSSVLKDKKTDDEEVKERQRRLDQIAGLENNLISLQDELTNGGGTTEEKNILRDKIKKLKQQIADLHANLAEPEVEDEPDAEGGGEPVEPVEPVGPETPTISVEDHENDLQSNHGDLAVGYTAELAELVDDDDGDETTENWLADNNTESLNSLADKIRDLLKRGRITEKMLVQIGPIIKGNMNDVVLESYERLIRVRDGQAERHVPFGIHKDSVQIKNMHNHADDTITFLEQFFNGKLPGNLDAFVPEEDPGHIPDERPDHMVL